MRPHAVTLDGGPHDGAVVLVHPDCKAIGIRGEPLGDGRIPWSAYWRHTGRAEFRSSWFEYPNADEQPPRDDR